MDRQLRLADVQRRVEVDDARLLLRASSSTALRELLQLAQVGAVDRELDLGVLVAAAADRGHGPDAGPEVGGRELRQDARRAPGSSPRTDRAPLVAAASAARRRCRRSASAPDRRRPSPACSRPPAAGGRPSRSGSRSARLRRGSCLPARASRPRTPTGRRSAGNSCSRP